MRDESFLDMAITDLKARIIILEAVKETNQMNDKDDAKLVASIFREIDAGNKKLLRSLDNYIKHN